MDIDVYAEPPMAYLSKNECRITGYASETPLRRIDFLDLLRDIEKSRQKLTHERRITHQTNENAHLTLDKKQRALDRRQRVVSSIAAQLLRLPLSVELYDPSRPVDPSYPLDIEDALLHGTPDNISTQ